MLTRYEREMFPQPLQPIADFANEFMQNSRSADSITPMQMLVCQAASNALSEYVDAIGTNPRILASPEEKDKVIQAIISDFKRVVKEAKSVTTESFFEKYPILKTILSEQ